MIAHATFFLYLTTGDKWTLSPVIIYNEDSMLHPQNITMEGIGRTVQLLCVGSKVNQTKSVMVKSYFRCNYLFFKGCLFKIAKYYTLCTFEKPFFILPKPIWKTIYKFGKEWNVVDIFQIKSFF